MNLRLPDSSRAASRFTHELVLRLTIPGEPVAKGRPRFTRKGQVYTPERTRRAEDLLKWMAWERLQRGGPTVPESGPVSVTARFYCQRAKDLDNLVKLLDAFNGIVWRDDRQVVQLHASRFDRQSDPRTEIEVFRIVALNHSPSEVE